MLKTLLLLVAVTLAPLTLTACEKTIHEARRPVPTGAPVALASDLAR